MDKKENKSIISRFKRLANRAASRILSFYKNMPIRIKLMLILNIAILIPLIIISFVSYRSSENILETKSINYSQDILKLINLRVGDYISRLDSMTEDLMENHTVYNYYQHDKAQPYSVGEYHDEVAVREILRDKIHTDGEMQSAAISAGKLYCYADDTSLRQSLNSIMPHDGVLYKKVLAAAYKGEGAPIWYLDSAGGKVKHIFYARAIIDRVTYKNSGMIVLMINPVWFNTIFNGIANDDMKNTEVISEDKQVVLSNPGSAGYKISDDIFKNMSYDYGWIIDNQQNALVSYVTVSGKTLAYAPRWKIATYIPLSMLYKDVDYLKQKVLITLILAVTIMLFVSFYISYDFVSSINKIVNGMKRLQKGDEHAQVNLTRKDELGFMGSAFNNMVKEITTLQKWVIREQLTRKDAQIKALQSQINPHFLFNTLESINWMAMLNNMPEISETVTALASLMEASTARGDKCIPLKEEFKYIDNYMFILKKRFEGRLELIKNVDENILEVRVPRLLIQPLVENAVNHGIAESRKNGIITLTAVKNEGCVNITVEDNGAGIDPDDLEIINERLSMSDDEYFMREKKRKRGIGLENVNRRIKLFYGSQYGIKIESEKGKFTRVHVDIPPEAIDRTKLEQNSGSSIKERE